MIRAKTLSVYELFLFELCREMFLQLRGESKPDYLDLESLAHRRNTRSGSANLILSAKLKTAKMQHSLKRLLTKAYNLLMKSNLIPEHICNLNKYAF